MNDETKEVARNAYKKAFLGAIAMYRHPLVYDHVLDDVIANEFSAINNDDANPSNDGPKAWVSRQFLKDDGIRAISEDCDGQRGIVSSSGYTTTLDLAHKMTRGLNLQHLQIQLRKQTILC
jgi:hypothetical protein